MRWIVLVLYFASPVFSQSNSPLTLMSNNEALLGTYLHGSSIYQDGKPEWLKIDGVVLGCSYQFQTQQITTDDIGKVLNQMVSSDDVQMVAYNWKSGLTLIRDGFNLKDSTDSVSDSDVTTFIIKNRAALQASMVTSVDSSGNTTIGQTSTQYDAAASFVTAYSNHQTPDEFVRWTGRDFKLGSSIFYPCGPNIYWLGITGDMKYPPASQVDEMFRVAVKIGSTTIRSHTLGGSTGSRKTLLPALRTYNQEAWASIDYSFYMARKSGIKLIVPLTDSYSYSHGNYGDFCKFRGVSKDQFWTNRLVIDDFKDYIRVYLNHVNPYTGIAIKNDTTLFSIELGNELGNIRPAHDSLTIPTKDWLLEISAFIKTIDTNHFILDPSDECLGKSDNFNITPLDAYSAHFYQTDYKRLDTLSSKAALTNKPLIVGEFSSHFGDDWFRYIENNANIKGSFFWSLFAHDEAGKKVEHNDGFTLHYPEDAAQLDKITQHFKNLKEGVRSKVSKRNCLGSLLGC